MCFIVWSVTWNLHLLIQLKMLSVIPKIATLSDIFCLIASHFWLVCEISLIITFSMKECLNILHFWCRLCKKIVNLFYLSINFYLICIPLGIRIFESEMIYFQRLHSFFKKLKSVIFVLRMRHFFSQKIKELSCGNYALNYSREKMWLKKDFSPWIFFSFMPKQVSVFNEEYMIWVTELLHSLEKRRIGAWLEWNV